MQTHRWRVPIAFVLAPIAPCGLYALTMSTIAQQWNGLVPTIAVMVVASQALTLVLAVPAYLLLKRFWKVRLIECLVAGALVALVLGLVSLMIPLSSGYSAGDSGGDTVINGKLTTHGYVCWAIGTAESGLLGAAMGFAFWLLAYYRAPTQRTPVSPVRPSAS